MKYLSSDFLQSFVNFVKNTDINGYDSYDEKGMGPVKERFKKESMMILKEIADRMGLIKGTYKVSFNPGGPAVSGDPILHGENIYCNMSKFMDTFYYRKCDGITDYLGFRNCNMNWDKLQDLAYVACVFKATAQSNETRRY